jgi:hypothetical protein
MRNIFQRNYWKKIYISNNVYHIPVVCDRILALFLDFIYFLWNLSQRIFFAQWSVSHGYGPFVVVIIRSFPHSRFINWYVTWVIRQVPQVEQKLPTLPEHLSFTFTPCLLAGFVMLNRNHTRLPQSKQKGTRVERGCWKSKRLALLNHFSEWWH